MLNENYLLILHRIKVAIKLWIAPNDVNLRIKILFLYRKSFEDALYVKSRLSR